MLPRVWDKPVGDIALTNCSTYREIAIEACEISRDLLDAGRRPKDNGGWVLSYDPERRSFKSACIAIVFAGVWFEAAAHLAFVERHGPAGAKEFDHLTYEDKLKSLGCSDSALIEQARRIRQARKELVHEKAYLDYGQLRPAQGEAENAHQFLLALSDERGRLILANPTDHSPNGGSST